jgi:hypothetical protein
MFCSPRYDEESRTVVRMLRYTAACVCAWSLAILIADGQEVRPRFLLASSQIVSAMEERQLPTRGVQVRLAAPITAAIANPQLEVLAISLLSPHEMRLRLTCRDRSLCLSFFAIATYPEAVNPSVLKIKPDGEPSEIAKYAPASKAVADVPAASLPVKQAGSGLPPILHSGSPASLDFDEERVHVRIEVICLESGAVGDKIRVTTRDHKQIYVAEIVTPVLLKGTF